jgi:hypothetical protein
MIFSTMRVSGVHFEYKILTLATYSAKNARFLDAEGCTVIISGGEGGNPVQKVHLPKKIYRPK